MSDPSRVGVSGPLAPHMAGFVGELQRLGYTPLSSVAHARLTARLSRWLAERGLAVSALTQETVEVFFAERRAAGYVNSRTSRSVRPLMDYLRRLGVAPHAPSALATTPVELLLERYRGHLTAERGLAAATVELNVRLARPFLAGRAPSDADGRLGLEQLTAAEVSAFVVAQCRQRPRSASRIVTALRSLLGFLHVDGITGSSLATAVPSAAAWRLAGLPQGLDGEQAAALLGCCDRQAATGRRDFAVLTLLVRLGLRAGEVAALTFDDIDWRQGEITVRGKGNRHDRLPLPADVGEAIVDYLRDGRPTAAQARTVFVGAQAPHRALKSNAVTTIVVVAGRRAGVGRVGAHRLRHSAATSMLRAGGSLQEIGQVLRHRRALTTAIYAKVDQQALRQLARPWPGEQA